MSGCVVVFACTREWPRACPPPPDPPSQDPPPTAQGNTQPPPRAPPYAPCLNPRTTAKGYTKPPCLGPPPPRLHLALPGVSVAVSWFQQACRGKGQGKHQAQRAQVKRRVAVERAPSSLFCV